MLVPDVQHRRTFTSLDAQPYDPIVTIVLIRKVAIVVVAVDSIVVGNVALILTDLGAAGSVELFQV